MINLNASEPHFIRCIKPNMRKKPATFDNELVTKQLRYTGMLETTRIRREGYPVRPVFEDFVYRYKVLGYYLSATVQPNAGTVTKILQKSGTQGWLIGKTRVFMKYYHVDQLNDKLRPINGKAIIIQKWVRRFVAKRQLKALKAKARAYAKQVQDFLTAMTRNVTSTRDAINSLIEADNKRPASYWSKPHAPPPVDRTTKGPQESISSAQSKILHHILLAYHVDYAVQAPSSSAPHQSSGSRKLR